MNKILLVEDDLVVLKLYGDALRREGMEVETAPDGVAGIAAMSQRPPDLVVLDLLMPRLSGQEVLKYMRAQESTRNTPVIVFSNTYLTELTNQAVSLGIDRVVLKASCTVSQLALMIREVIEERKTGSSHQKNSAVNPQPVPTPEPLPVTAQTSPDFDDSIRRQFLAGAESRLGGIWSVFKSLHHAEPGPQQMQALSLLYEHIHNLATASALAGSHSIAQLSAALEALLHQLVQKPAHLTPSVRRTLTVAMDELTALFSRVTNSPAIWTLRTVRVLVVDDDPIANRVIASSLRQAKLDPAVTEDPVKGLRQIAEEQFDLVLLDIEMPGINGLEFCRHLRKTPGYEHTPVIYVTAHSDFETRARSMLSGGTDLIAKPVFPLELATKAVMHLLRDGRKA